VYLATLKATEDAQLKTELARLWESAREHLFRRRFADARRDLEKLLPHADHEYVKSRRAEVDKMFSEIDQALSAAEKLALELRGKVSYTERGQVQVLYDFEDKKHFEAFLPVEKAGDVPLKGQWKVVKGAIESSGDTAALQWKPRVRGDLEIEYELTPANDPQNVVVDLYYQPGGSKHYAVWFGFDWVGPGRGDTDNTAEERNGMPRTCVVKMPVTADVERWVMPEQWEGWKKRLVGGPKGDARPERGRKTVVRIERRSPGVRLLLDGLLVWEGSDAEYSEGHVLFFADSRARIDNLAITFTPGR
jgi:hypothetical protein